VPRFESYVIILGMNKGLRFLVLVLSVVFAGNICLAKAEYNIVPLPDTIMQKTPLDAAVYNNTAEFFTPYIVNEINKTQFMNCPTVTDVRAKVEADYWLAKSTAKAMDDFRRFYKLDFGVAKKIAKLYDTNLVLLVTSATDSYNYIARRTWWDFFNIAGASVIDPAYKINIYAVLIDTDKDMIVWNKSYQKTLSVVENRIIAVGYAPQTEQLQKIKDYSVYLAPRIAQSIQDALLTEAQKLVEPNMIHTDYGSIDNVFTKKYRGLRKEIKDATVVPAAKTREGYAVAKEKYNEIKEDFTEYYQQKQQEKMLKQDKEEIQPINFLFFKKKSSTPLTEPQPVQEIPAVMKQTATPVVEQTKENVQVVKPEVKTLVQEKQEKAVTPAVLPPQRQVVQKQEKLNTTPESKIIEPKELPIPSDIEEQSNTLLNKAFRNRQTDFGDDELPIDATIYTSPSKYKVNEYLPIKPRLREIKTDDIYNAF